MTIRKQIKFLRIAKNKNIDKKYIALKINEQRKKWDDFQFKEIIESKNFYDIYFEK